MRGATAASLAAAAISDWLAERLGELTRDFQARAMQQSRQDPDYFMKSLRLQGWFVDNLERQLNGSRERMAGVYGAVVADHTAGLFPEPDDSSEAEPARDRSGVQDAWSESGC
jgi:hypothetical protein